MRGDYKSKERERPVSLRRSFAENCSKMRNLVSKFMDSVPLLLQLLLLVHSSLFLRLANGQSEGDVRLAGSLPYQGRLEVYHDGSWGTVCDDRFRKPDADVACRQLGFNEGSERVITTGFSNNQFKPGTGKIWMDGVDCGGSETKLSSCRFNGWGINDCHHYEDIAIICKYTPPTLPPTTNRPTLTDDNIRVSCPGPDYGLGECKNCSTYSSSCRTPNRANPAIIGVVEMLVDGAWYPLPRRGWNLNAAKVVCGQLGYPRAGPVPGINRIFPVKQCGTSENTRRCAAIRHFRDRLSQTITEGLTCTGGEDKLNDCYFRSYSVRPSSPSGVATIQCSHDDFRAEKCADNSNKELYRLRGGPTPWQGRVEVRVGGVWGSICDLFWDTKDANIVCRNLGFGSAKKVHTRSHYGRGSAKVHFSGLKCSGTEELLSQCTRTTGTRLASEVNSYCYQHSGDAGVECNVPDTCSKEPEVRFTGSGLSRFTEVMGPSGWGRLCFESITSYKEAHVMCREVSNEFAARYLPIKDSTYRRRSYTVQYKCTGEELHTSDCPRTFRLSSCVNYTRIDCTSGLPDLVPNLQRFESSLKTYSYVSPTPMYYLSCALEENCLSSSAHLHAGNPSHNRRLLRFDSLTMNYGTALFLPNLEPHEWEWHACHQHYHSFEAFINYDVLDLKGKKVAEGHKASFCLEDSVCDFGGYNSYRCSSGRQGISVNCGDLYARHLDCQWIDITDLPINRNYIVRQIVNADSLVGESDYRNNIIQCELFFRGDSFPFIVSNCTHSDHY